jgi:hypothetical protein
LPATARTCSGVANSKRQHQPKVGRLTVTDWHVAADACCMLMSQCPCEQ